VPRRLLAWDCATGNGQAARDLARYFERVIATDASAEQIAHATPVPNVEYRVARAEASGLSDHSVDLVTVAQALHWLPHDAFYAEVRRVTEPDGVLAAWCYGSCHAGDDVEAILRAFETGKLGPYWHAGRHWVVDEYRSIPFPFEEIAPPSFAMRVEWTLPQLGQYLNSWSAVENYKKQCDEDPVPAVLEEIAPHWGKPNNKREVVWPVGLRVGRVS
jgi:ubiquinone/menaquinone biosynthesis C-methylase UbiE